MLVEGCVLEHAVDDVAASSCEADDGCVVAFAFVAFALVVDVAFGIVERAMKEVCHRAFLRRLSPPRAGCSPRMLVPLLLVTGAMPA